MTVEHSVNRSWMVLSLGACVVLAAIVGWLALGKIPEMRSELDAVTTSRDELQKKASPVREVLPGGVEPNVAVVTLTAKDAELATPKVRLTPTSSHFVVVIDAPPSTSRRGSLEITSVATGLLVTSVPGLVRNADAVWTVTLPAETFPDAKYRFRLSEDPATGGLLGDFLVSVERQPQ